MSEIFLLTLASLFTSTISGMIGMAGGITLLSIMSLFMGPATLIPIHGVIQLTSNTSRTLLNFPHVSSKHVAFFAVGGLIGIGVGAQVLVVLPEKTYLLLLGAFILVITWMPKLKMIPVIPMKFGFLGAGATFISLFAGATGPILAPFFLREGLTKEGIVATKAACQLVVHSLKVIVFGAIGFAFADHLELIISMAIASVVGTALGKILLGKINETVFLWLFKGVITLLSLRMLILGVLA